MTQQSSPQDRRDRWLELVRRINCRLLTRKRLLLPVGKEPWASPDPESHERPPLMRLNEDLEQLSRELAAIEPGDPPLGAEAVFLDAQRVGAPVRVGLAVLVMARLSPTVAAQVRTVGELAELVGGEDPSAALAVREAFGTRGDLRPYVHCLRALQRDRWEVSLSEMVFAVAGRHAADDGACEVGADHGALARGYVRLTASAHRVR